MVNHAYISAMSANIVAFAAGTTFTWPSPILPKLNSADADVNPIGKPITSEEMSWIGSLQGLGAILGPLIFGFIIDKLGRKITLLFVGIPFIVSFLIAAFAKIVALFYIARFIMGLGIGGVFAVIPMYIGEIADSKTRGALSSAMNCLMTAGMLFSFAVGPYVSIMVFNILLVMIPTISTILFFFVGLESPYYYVGRGNYDAALKSLEKLRGSTNQNNEFELSEIKRNVDNNKSGNIKDLFKSKGLIKALMMCLALVFFQQFSGMNAVLSYTQNIFEAAGTSLVPEIASIILGVVQLVATFITPLFVDKSGRKILLYISAIGMCISQVVLGVYFCLQDNGTNVDDISWLPVVVMITFMVANMCGFAPLTWTIIGELFPSNVKSIAAAIMAAIGSLLGFLITKFLLSIGMAISFLIFGGCCALAFFFVLFFLVETKGKTLQEIQDILES